MLASLPVEAFAKIERLFTVLSSATRLKLLSEIFTAGELTVTELVRRSGMKFTAVSNQLRLMTDRGIVSAKKEGNYSYYRISDPATIKILKHSAGIVINGSAGSADHGRAKKLAIAFGWCCPIFMTATAACIIFLSIPGSSIGTQDSKSAFTDRSDHMAGIMENLRSYLDNGMALQQPLPPWMAEDALSKLRATDLIGFGDYGHMRQNAAMACLPKHGEAPGQKHDEMARPD